MMYVASSDAIPPELELVPGLLYCYKHRLSGHGCIEVLIISVEDGRYMYLYRSDYMFHVGSWENMTKGKLLTSEDVTYLTYED